MIRNLTYGEAHTREKESLSLINGEWVQTVHIIKKPQRMSREDANKYYTNKIRNYFGVKKEPVFYIRDREFENATEEYDYYEAMKYKEELLCGT